MTKLSKSQILKGTALPVAARSLEIFGEFFPTGMRVRKMDLIDRPC